MALMLAKTYDALRAAGAPEDKAREAAVEIASLDRRLTRMEIQLGIVVVGIVTLLVKIFAFTPVQ